MNKNLTPMSDVTVFGTEERKQRALILDAKLNDALLDTFIISAELVDERLYQELGFETARDYFENKSITIGQAYKYARIGREIKPLLLSTSTSKASLVANIGVKKLDEIVRHAADQIPALMKGDTIQLGDEEYSAEDLQEVSAVDLTEKLRKLSIKVERNEVLEQQVKTLELEKKALEKEVKEREGRDARYREISTSFDAIEKDLKEASAAYERVRVLVHRIDSQEIPDTLGLTLSTLITTIQQTSEMMAERHAQVMFNFADEL